MYHLMLKLWFLSLLLHQICWTEAVNLNAGGGVWFDVGITGTGAQTPPPFPNYKLYRAYLALQSWKSAITDDPFGILQTWAGSDVCSYKGIFCAESLDMSSGPVVAGIDLNHALLQGTLIKELSFLSDISIFHINTNRFTGTVPDGFKDLDYLSELDLSNNNFSGPFPYVTLQCPSLIYLDLRFNHFQGPIPDDLFNVNLDAIFLNNNKFDGQIPPSLGNSPASVITLANNNFSGSIPASFGYMVSRLGEILFLNNQLTGCIPEEVGFLTQMEVLDFSFNSLTGHIPDSLCCLSGIEILNFSHNELSGVLPDLICKLRRIANLTISYNFFSGFSQECSRLIFKNARFDLSWNCIPGRIMQRPPPECEGFQGGLNCLRIPSTRPLICRSVDQAAPAANSGPNPLAPSMPPP